VGLTGGRLPGLATLCHAVLCCRKRVAHASLLPPCQPPAATHTCSMLLMNVWGAVQRGVSSTYSTTVGKLLANSSRGDSSGVQVSKAARVSTGLRLRVAPLLSARV
jgi:hypothetical protein